MSNSVTYDKLKQIGEEIAQIKDEREFGRRLKYELLDFIERHPALHDEWKRRSEFYEKLPSTLAFQSLLDSIHKGFSELKKRIDPKLFGGIICNSKSKK